MLLAVVWAERDLSSSDVTCICMYNIENNQEIAKGLSDVYELISPVHNVFSANNQQRSRRGLPNEVL